MLPSDVAWGIDGCQIVGCEEPADVLVDRRELLCIRHCDETIERAEAVARNPAVREILTPLPSRDSRPLTYRPLPLEGAELTKAMRRVRRHVAETGRLEPPPPQDS